MGRDVSGGAIIPYAKARGSRRPFVRLDLNENRFAAPPAASRALRRLTPTELAMYPEDEPLRRRLARLHGVDAGCVLLAGGGDQAIRWSFEAFVAPGDEVVWAAPTFAVYPLAAALRASRARPVAFGPGFAFPLEGILAALRRRPALLVLVSPNNPTGTVIADDELRTILERAGGTTVLLDEAYGFFAGRDHGRWIRAHPNLVVLNSFSKSFGLAGLRLGYLLAEKERRRRLEAVALPFPVGAPAIAAGQAVLDDPAGALARARRLRRQQKRLLAGMRGLGIACCGTEANFVLADVGDAPALQAALRREGILVKGFPAEPRMAGWLRVTVGTARDNRMLLRALRRLGPFQALLLDMDGVLVDSRLSCDEALRRTVAHFCGRKPGARELDRLRREGGCNNDWRAAAALLRRRGCRVSFAAVKRHFQALYLGAGGQGLRPRERWQPKRALLRRLGARYALGIVTGRPRAEALWTLERAGCTPLFRELVAAEDTGRRPKPHPLGLRLALRRLGVRRAAYVGDQVDDMRAARAAGCRAIAVVPPQRRSRALLRSLRRAGAETVIRHIDDILEALNETGTS
jgi:histidinol-phosphate aminotransferase